MTTEVEYTLVSSNAIPTKIINTPTDDLVHLYKIFKHMEQICDKNNGIGLSAVQIGIPWKMFVIQGDGSGSIPKEKYWHFVDCEYNPVGLHLMKSLEGCLSLKDENGELLRYEVNRFPIVDIRGKRLVNQKEKGLILVPFSSTIAAHEQGIVFQHEIDHHHGILISTKVGSRRLEIW